MSHTEGLNAMETALRCVQQQEDSTPEDLLLLRRLRYIAAKKRGTAIKQKTLTHLPDDRGNTYLWNVGRQLF
jgi:hypothetical protein